MDVDTKLCGRPEPGMMERVAGRYQGDHWLAYDVVFGLSLQEGRRLLN